MEDGPTPESESFLKSCLSSDTGQPELLPPPLCFPTQPPYFAEELSSWVVTRYCDVSVILQDVRFQIANGGDHYLREGAPETIDVSAARHSELLDGARVFFSRVHAGLPSVLAGVALDGGAGCDLLDEFLRPVCLELASMGLACRMTEEALDLAWRVFLSSAYPYDVDLQNSAFDALQRLADMVPRDRTVNVQAFVAAVTSLPAFVANSLWLLNSRLVNNNCQLRELPRGAVDECLRLSCVPCLVFRKATKDVSLAACKISPGDRLVLMVHMANRDPCEFDDPAVLDITRTNDRHLSFGRGSHACVASRLVRVVGGALINFAYGTARIRSFGYQPRWKGIGIRYLETFPVASRRQPVMHARR